MALLICLLLDASHWMVISRNVLNTCLLFPSLGPRATTLCPLPLYQSFLLPAPSASLQPPLKCRTTWPLCLGTTKMTSVGGPSSWSQTSVHGSEMLIPMTGAKSSTNCESEAIRGVRMQVRTPAVPAGHCPYAPPQQQRLWEGRSRAAQPSAP